MKTVSDRAAYLQQLKTRSQAEPTQVFREVLVSTQARERVKYCGGQLVTYELIEYYGYRIPALGTTAVPERSSTAPALLTP